MIFIIIHPQLYKFSQFVSDAYIGHPYAPHVDYIKIKVQSFDVR